MSRREERAIREEADLVVAEAEATLAGQLSEQRGGEATVPGWVWLNTLAHSDWDALQRLSEGHASIRRAGWASAIEFLAGEVLTASASPAGLRDMQREELIPLELDILAGKASTPVTPVDLVAGVRARLAAWRSHRVHPSMKARPHSDGR